jgi:hypothetical protein
MGGYKSAEKFEKVSFSNDLAILDHLTPCFSGQYEEHGLTQASY